MSQPIGTIGPPVRSAFGRTIGANPNQVDMFNAARQSYFDNLTRGADILNRLETRKATGTPSQDGATKDGIYQTAYETRVVPDRHTPGLSIAKTKGLNDVDIPYTNLIELGENMIRTSQNYAVRDLNRGPDANGDAQPFLNNSDVFWYQWNAAVDAGTNQGTFESANKFNRRKDRKRKALGHVARQAIINSDTILTVQHALPDGESFSTDNNTNYQFSADSEEFLAILGTPNGRGVGFLLSDHYHEMEKQSFGSVTAKAGETSLIFDFE